MKPGALLSMVVSTAADAQGITGAEKSGAAPSGCGLAADVNSLKASGYNGTSGRGGTGARVAGMGAQRHRPRVAITLQRRAGIAARSRLVSGIFIPHYESAACARPPHPVPSRGFGPGGLFCTGRRCFNEPSHNPHRTYGKRRSQWCWEETKMGTGSTFHTPTPHAQYCCVQIPHRRWRQHLPTTAPSPVRPPCDGKGTDHPPSANGPDSLAAQAKPTPWSARCRTQCLRSDGENLSRHLRGEGLLYGHSPVWPQRPRGTAVWGTVDGAAVARRTRLTACSPGRAQRPSSSAFRCDG